MSVSCCRILMLAGLGLAASGAFSRAQQTTPTKDVQQQATPAKDVHATYEPPSGPGAGQAFLKRFEGEWDVQRNFYPPSGGPPSRATGECTQKMIQDGRFLQSDFTFHQDGRTTTGTGISGFDPQTGLFTTVWYDSRSTRMSIRQSREPFNNKEIVLYSASPGSAAPQRESRTQAHLEEEGRKLIHQQFNKGADGKERLLMELILTRKSSR